MGPPLLAESPSFHPRLALSSRSLGVLVVLAVLCSAVQCRRITARTIQAMQRRCFCAHLSQLLQVHVYRSCLAPRGMTAALGRSFLHALARAEQEAATQHHPLTRLTSPSPGNARRDAATGSRRAAPTTVMRAMAGSQVDPWRLAWLHTCTSMLSGSMPNPATCLTAGLQCHECHPQSIPRSATQFHSIASGMHPGRA
jgi:hypothetical protein